VKRGPLGGNVLAAFFAGCQAPRYMKVKDCGPRVGLNEISYAQGASMCMDIRLWMSS
jgi:hypothetical protein